MAHLKEIVDRISLIAATQQITKAMKMVSASKLHKAQQRLYWFKEYLAHYTTLIDAALQDVASQQLTHPLMQKKNTAPERLLLIVITADRGLCGAFNKNILKVVNKHIVAYQKNHAPSAVDLLVIGKKAYQFFNKSNLKIIEDYVDILQNKDNNSNNGLANYCMHAFQQGEYSEITVAYSAFTNAVKQTATLLPFLPFIPKAALASTDTHVKAVDYIYEPAQPILIEGLIPSFLQHILTHALIESSASEHAARMVTMGQATDNADELLKTLRVNYNRTRQSLITNVLAEITRGAVALEEA